MDKVFPLEIVVNSIPHICCWDCFFIKHKNKSIADFNILETTLLASNSVGHGTLEHPHFIIVVFQNNLKSTYIYI